jgi:hypothetical protein
VAFDQSLPEDAYWVFVLELIITFSSKDPRHVSAIDDGWVGYLDGD